MEDKEVLKNFTANPYSHIFDFKTLVNEWRPIRYSRDLAALKKMALIQVQLEIVLAGVKDFVQLSTFDVLDDSMPGQLVILRGEELLQQIKHRHQFMVMVCKKLKSPRKDWVNKLIENRLADFIPNINEVEDVIAYWRDYPVSVINTAIIKRISELITKPSTDLPKLLTLRKRCHNKAALKLMIDSEIKTRVSGISSDVSSDYNDFIVILADDEVPSDLLPLFHRQARKLLNK